MSERRPGTETTHQQDDWERVVTGAGEQNVSAGRITCERQLRHPHLQSTPGSAARPIESFYADNSPRDLNRLRVFAAYGIPPRAPVLRYIGDSLFETRQTAVTNRPHHFANPLETEQ